MAHNNGRSKITTVEVVVGRTCMATAIAEQAGPEVHITRQVS